MTQVRIADGDNDIDRAQTSVENVFHATVGDVPDVVSLF